MIESLRNRYEVLFGLEPASSHAVAELESQLGVRLPGDFRRITTFFSGGYLGGKSLNAVSCGGNATNILDETRRLRKAIDLPENMIVLAELAASLIVMECVGDRGRVIWIDATDALNLAHKSSLRAPEIWESYSEFFEELLNEEEEERGVT